MHHNCTRPADNLLVRARVCTSAGVFFEYIYVAAPPFEARSSLAEYGGRAGRERGAVAPVRNYVVHALKAEAYQFGSTAQCAAGVTREQALGGGVADTDNLARTHSSCRPTDCWYLQGNFRLFKDTEIKITDTGGKGGAGKVLTISALHKDGIADREWVLTGETPEQVRSDEQFFCLAAYHACTALAASALPLSEAKPAADWQPAFCKLHNLGGVRCLIAAVDVTCNTVSQNAQ
jgi:hypothetical protein